MKMNPALLFVFVLSLFVAASYGFVTNHPQESIDNLYLTGTSSTSSHVIITYDITFAGFVELHLFDAAGKKVWIHGIAEKEIGSHEMHVPAKNMKHGEPYKFILKYKGQDHKGDFTAP